MGYGWRTRLTQQSMKTAARSRKAARGSRATAPRSGDFRSQRRAAPSSSGGSSPNTISRKCLGLGACAACRAGGRSDRTGHNDYLRSRGFQYRHLRKPWRVTSAGNCPFRASRSGGLAASGCAAVLWLRRKSGRRRASMPRAGSGAQRRRQSMTAYSGSHT